ncbi:MAG: rRNA maturation RNase YbeY [Acidimicrobiaceae bacterium]|nr:rRNA maturation RNase YbeY [Acidimicrobiaceae bacterium]MDE0515892.1 rRNA maturation RNase YbeY [Acidimicrobiaceae bacterium]MDE0656367.1 rRNA maturation RNase YbeY [Acidimicrobiaceae bacterium]MXZ95544.1 rRNA maturation RNase YbeY [Acidimicrobiaceae bacterium]MYF42790.1 rRNA maturation RNase YbeY [Acidimicrobiaceae bacterium]
MVPASSPDEPACGAVVRAFDETSGPAAGNDPVDTGRWARLARAVLRDEGVGSGELGLRFVDSGAMAELNLAHMGTPGPTDVLAFPIDGGHGGAPASEPTVLLGDVVVCPEYASRTNGDPAASGNPRPADELALLVVHGVLHVLGYDHAREAEAVAMQTREQQLLAAHHRQP